MPISGSVIVVPSTSTATRTALINYQSGIYNGTNTIAATDPATFFVELDIDTK